MLKKSKRGQIPPFIVMDIMRLANDRSFQGQNILHLEVGQPSTGAPKGVIEATKNLIGKDTLGYTLSFGRKDLRKRIALHYEEFYNFEVDPSRIAVTTGSSGAFILAFLAAFDVGDRVAMSVPSYPAYRNILNALGIEVIDVPTGVETNFQPTIALLEEVRREHKSLDGLIVASPSNPTGTMLKNQELKEIALYCIEHQIRLISDEIYHGITYELEAETALKFNDDCVIINSFSKYFSMTGWRLGWIVMPSDLVRSIECLSQNLFIAAPTISQVAACAAFDCHDELKNNLNVYAKNRAILLRELPKAGFSKLARSDGAFYIYANIESLANDSMDFCNMLLEDVGIAATPGIDFDPIRGKSYLRFSFSRSTEEIKEAATRLVTWYGSVQ